MNIKTLGLYVAAAITAIGVTRCIGIIARKEQEIEELEHLDAGEYLELKES